VAGGLCSVLLTQTAYQAARPLLTLPVIAAVTPMASVAIGIGFLGETARIGAGHAIAAGIVAACTVTALAILARSPRRAAPPASSQLTYPAARSEPARRN
jgi:hypothetical protein